MTQSQKKVVEWPFILLIIWLLQVLEISILRLPWELGPIHVFPVLLSYLALTRTWGWLAFLSFVFSFLASANIGYPWPVYVAVHTWTVLVLKALMLTFRLEGRDSFAGMAAAGNAISKICIWITLSYFGTATPVGLFLKDFFVSSLVSVVLAWFLFPLFAAWDGYFEHEADEARELQPGALR